MTGWQYPYLFYRLTINVNIIVKLFYYCRLLAQTSLRNILGTKNLHEILSDRESISIAMQVLSFIIQTNNVIFGAFNNDIIFVFSKGILDEATTAWGIKVERVEM